MVAKSVAENLVTRIQEPISDQIIIKKSMTKSVAEIKSDSDYHFRSLMD